MASAPYTRAVELTRHETDAATVEVARRTPCRELGPFLGRALEGWTQTRGTAVHLREVPFPGLPLILNLGPRWEVDGEPLDSFVAGLHERPAFVAGEPSYSCVELRLSPLGARRLFGLPLHELANTTVALEDVLPGAAELTERLRESSSWATRLDLVEAFVLRRLAASDAPHAGVAWAWRSLVTSGGRAGVGTLAAELGWSRRRLVARFREEIGLAPKAAARVIRFDRAIARLRSGSPFADVASACGYYDQAHLNREFRELAWMTPGEFRSASAPTGAVLA
jgi:AraC-like DNA-binding protein